MVPSQRNNRLTLLFVTPPPYSSSSSSSTTLLFVLVLSAPPKNSKDAYPPAQDDTMEAPTRGNGNDFNPDAPYRMYHGDTIPGT